ncbi:hypothetical protein [Amycolatopsis sp. NPDC051061]|uniref:hypothetical protein n=1 Tax=Amycolatopsis sp. NPDC051061 TaxID=3155042 RepID=UPI00344699B8
MDDVTGVHTLPDRTGFLGKTLAAAGTVAALALATAAPAAAAASPPPSGHEHGRSAPETTLDGLDEELVEKLVSRAKAAGCS